MWLKEFTIDIKNGMYRKILNYAYQIKVYEAIFYNIKHSLTPYQYAYLNFQYNLKFIKKEMLTDLYNTIYKTNL